MPRDPPSSRPTNGLPWSRPTSAASASSAPVAAERSAALKPTSNTARTHHKPSAQKRSRMEKLGSPPPFNPPSGPAPPAAVADSAEPDIMSINTMTASSGGPARPMTSQGAMQHHQVQHHQFPHAHPLRDAFSPTAAHVSHTRPSTAGGQLDNRRSPWASSSSSHQQQQQQEQQPNVMHVPQNALDQMLQQQLDGHELDEEDAIMMSVDPELLNSTGTSSSSFSGQQQDTASASMPMTPRRHHPQAPLTPPASSSTVGRVSFTIPSSSTLVHRPPHHASMDVDFDDQQHPTYSPTIVVPGLLDPHPHPHPHVAYPNMSTAAHPSRHAGPMSHPQAAPPASPVPPVQPVQPMTLDQLDAFLQAQLNQLLAAFSDVHDVYADAQWRIDSHLKHVQQATDAARNERDRLQDAIQGKWEESQALIASPLGGRSGATTRSAAGKGRKEQEESGAKEEEARGNDTAGSGTQQGAQARQEAGAGKEASSSPRPLPPGSADKYHHDEYRDYEEQLGVDEGLKSSPRSNGAPGGSPGVGIMGSGE